MNAAQFAHFFERQGYHVVESGSCWWYNRHPFVYTSLPFHRLVVPSRSELAHVFARRLAALVRFPRPGGAGADSGIWLCSDPTYDLHSLQQKARNRVRRALESCTVERVDHAFLATHGYALFEDTLLRQGRDPAQISEKEWRRYCEVADETAGTEAWGAFVGGRLASFLSSALVEDHFSFLEQCSATEYLHCSPNNALIFTVTRHHISSPRVKAVSYGLQSVEKTASLDHFKATMGFQLHPIQPEVVLNPLFKGFLACGGRAGVTWLAGRNRENDTWRKAGVILQTLESYKVT
jgi:hypothetical protein